MNRPVVLAAAAFLTALPLAPRAAPPAPQAATAASPDPKALIERTKKCVRAIGAHVATVTYDRKDVERYLAESRSFEALRLDEPPLDEQGLPKCVDVAAVLADPKLVAWARERKLDPRDWMLKSVRIGLTHARWRAPADAAAMKAQLDQQRRELAKSCKSMGPNACRDIEQAFATGDAAMRENTALMAVFPEPTRAEAALLAEYDARLREVHRRDEPGPARDEGGEGPQEDGGDAGAAPPEAAGQE